MRILEVAGSGFLGTEEMGPVTNDIFQLSREFLRRGHDVTTVDVTAEAERTLLPSDLPLVEVRGRPLGASRNRARTRLGRAANRWSAAGQLWRRQIHFARRLNRVLPLERFDIVHVHAWRLAYLMHTLLGRDPIYTAHTPNWAARWHGGRLTHRLWRTLHGYLPHEIGAIRAARATVALGDYLPRLLPGSRIEVIPNGTEPARWRRRDQAAARAALGYERDEFLVYFVGRICPIKGLHTLLDAVAMTDIPGLRVNVMGSAGGGYNADDSPTEYARTVRARAQHLPVEFLGFVSNRTEAFQQHLSAADVLVVPSLFEHQGNVVLEALALELPVIASDVGGLSQLVPPSVGRRVPPGDPNALAQQLQALAAAPQARAAMRGRCRGHLEHRFTWAQCARQHLELFETVTRGQARNRPRLRGVTPTG